MTDLVEMIKKEKIAKISVIIFLLLTIWWITIFLGGTKDSFENNLFGFVYGGFSIFGGIIGLMVSKKWGGFSSYIGKALIFLSLGLLLQAFGQYSFWFYNVFFKINVPYPGVPDIGFFGTIPFYIFGGVLLAKSSGVHISTGTITHRLQIILIPGLMLAVAYSLFLKNYDFDLSHAGETFLNFGYPTGQAIYISIAILTYSLSRKILGGMMRVPILLLIIAFMAQFLSDYSFVYFQNIFFPGCFVDYMYLVAYFLMSLGLINFDVVAERLKN